MQIAIASGKGGTGKTSVAVHLYHYLSRLLNNQIQLVDCDVEEPNDLLFFPGAQPTSQKEVFTHIPKIDNTQCTFCKKCTDWCEFNAISIVKRIEFAEVNKDLCHSCGACSVACENNAITEIQHPLGTISKFDSKFGYGITEGRLVVGSTLQTSLVKRLKENIKRNNILTLLDAPPGTSCPVVEVIAGADYVILVSEPTPFGLHDLKLAVQLVKEMGIPFGVIVNKANWGNDEIFNYLNKNKIDLIGKIPFSKDFAYNYSNGSFFQDSDREIKKAHLEIADYLKQNIL